MRVFNTFKGLLSITIIYFGIFQLVACQRPTAKQESRLQISLPQSKLSASGLSMLTLTSSDLKYLLVNVTGEGINQPVIYEWNRCESCSNSTVPGSFEVAVPMGPKRLFQVIAYYENYASEESALYYGDVPDKNLELAAETLVVPISLKSSGAIKRGTVMGRYIGSSVSDTPTGLLRAFYEPDSNKPPMEVFRSPMNGGWFRIPMFDGLRLTYRLPGNLPFLTSDGKLQLADSPLSASHKVMRLEYPDYWKGSTAGSRSFRKGGKMVLGFWGDYSETVDTTSGDDLYNVCYPSVPGSFTSLFLSDAAAAAALGFEYSVGPLTASKLIFSGGLSCTDPVLSGSVEFFRHLKFSPERFENHEPFFTSGFMNIFSAINAQDGKERLMDFIGSQLKIKTLPGVSADQLVVYKLVSSNHMEFGDRDLCPMITSGMAPGWSYAGAGGITAFTPLLINLSVSDAERSDLHLALCPRSSSGLWRPGGMTIPFWKFNQMTSTNYYSRFEGLPVTLTQGYCHSFTLNSFKYNGTTAAPEGVDMNYTIDLNPTSGMGVTVYPSSDCTGSPVSSLSIANGANVSSVYSVKVTVSGAFDFGATKNPSSALSKFVVGGEPSFPQQRFNVAAPFFVLNGPGSNAPVTLIPNECYHFGVTSMHANGFNVFNFPWNSSGLINIILGTVFAGAYFDNTCGAAAGTTFEMGTGSSSVGFSLKTGTSSVTSGSITIAQSSLGFLSKSFSYTLATGMVSSMAAKLVFEGFPGDPLSVGVCYPINASLMNESGALVSAKDTLAFNLRSLNNLSFYNTPLCNDPLLNELIFQSGESKKALYARSLSSGSITPTAPTGVMAISLSSLPTSTSNPLPAGNSYISFNLPQWLAPIIGSNEFGAARTIPFTSNASQISCWNSDLATPCTALLNYDSVTGTGTFAWTLSAAQNKYRFKFILKKSGYEDKEIPMDPFAKLPPHYQILTCDDTLLGPSKDVTDINTKLTALSGLTGSQTLCLGLGITVTNTTGATVLLEGKNLIGRSDSNLTTIPFGSGQTVLLNLASSALNETVANLAFSTGNDQTAIVVGSSTGSKWISNISVSDSAATGYYSRGIKLNNATGIVNILNYKAFIYGTSGANYGILINGTGDGTVTGDFKNLVRISQSEFTLGSATTGPAIRVDSTISYSSQVLLENSKITVNSSSPSLAPVYLTNLYSGKTTNITLENTEIINNNSGGKGVQFDSNQANTGEIVIRNSFIKALQPLFLQFYTETNSTGSVKAYNSVFHVQGDSGVVNYAVPATTTGQSLRFTNNHFVKTAGPGLSPTVLANIIYGQSIVINHSAGGGATGGNRFCSTSDSNFGSLASPTTVILGGNLTTVYGNQTGVGLGGPGTRLCQ